uniref:Uncharacterized protein n=1 Tax=Nelumbo nucifera TaxID=4432 RepID=A0A822Z5C7_NELNU|nr:TPA_asm: hypothetical protein HUJ06_012891 [Nelumbo nucifera]
MGEPDIDKKTTQFITKLYATHISNLEWQVVKVQWIDLAIKDGGLKEEEEIDKEII